jgi:hypothetical protein
LGSASTFLLLLCEWWLSSSSVRGGGKLKQHYFWIAKKVAKQTRHRAFMSVRVSVLDLSPIILALGLGVYKFNEWMAPFHFVCALLQNAQPERI